MDRRQEDDAAHRLDYGELAARNGDHATGLATAEEVLAAAGSVDLRPALHLRARMLRASSWERLGDFPRAIAELEALIAESPRTEQWIDLVVVLCRCHKLAGDYDRMIEVAAEAMPDIERHGLEDSDHAIRLAVTVAGAHIQRGDHALALRLCERAAERAQAIGSDVGLASAYWNASVSLFEMGRAAEALVVGERALALFEAHGRVGAQRSLHQALALVSLRLDPPDLVAAQAHVDQALSTLEWSDASALDRAYVLYARAMVAQCRGDLEAARDACTECLGIVDDKAPSLAGFGYLLLGRIALSEGHRDEARRHVERAVLLLASCGQDRAIGQGWFELGGLLSELGDTRAAIDAYRRAAISTGVVRPEASVV